VTLSGFAGGEYLPLPASEGPAFPFLLTLDGYPTSSAIYAQGQRCSLKIQEIPEAQTLVLRPIHFTKNDGFVKRLRKKSNFCVALHPSSLQRTVSTPHSSGFARLEFGAFYFAIEF